MEKSDLTLPLAVIAAVTTGISHTVLTSNPDLVPITDATLSVSVGLALLAFAGVWINHFAHMNADY
jgi:hypothetical protein